MRSDPLEQLARRRLIVVATALVAVGALLGSCVSNAPDALPGIALGSPVLLHVERALVIGGAVAGALIFLLRGWAGYFPSKLSTSGAEYDARAAASRAAENEDEIGETLIRLEEEHVAFASSLREDIQVLERRVDRLGSQDEEVV